MKKVLIFRDKLLPYSQTFIKSQAEALKNWEYMYLTSNLTQGLPIEESRVLFLPKILKNKFVKKNLGPLYQFLYRRFIKKLKAMHFDLLHAHFGTDAIKVSEIAQDLNIPLVVTLHGTDINIYKEVWESGARGKNKIQYPAKLLAIANQKNTYFIAVSQAIKDRAIDFGIPSEKLTVRYIGVNTQLFKAKINPAKNKDILFVGRMIENKGVRVLLNAFAKVHSNVPETKLVLIGDGPEMDSYRSIAKSLRLPVEFLGVKSQIEVIQQLYKSRIFCLASHTIEDGASEGMATVVLEAQACGIPVVTSARGGSTEGIIHGETGFAFLEKDENQLADYLIELLKNDDLIEKMSINAVKHIHTNFDLQKCTIDLESFYDTLL